MFKIVAAAAALALVAVPAMAQIGYQSIIQPYGNSFTVTTPGVPGQTLIQPYGNSWVVTPPPQQPFPVRDSSGNVTRWLLPQDLN